MAFSVTSISVQTGPRTRFPASTGQSESSTQWSRGPSRQIELRVIPSDDEGGWRGIEGTTTHVERGGARSRVTTGDITSQKQKQMIANCGEYCGHMGRGDVFLCKKYS